VDELDTPRPAAARNREGANGFDRRVGGLAAVVADGDARESGAGPPRRRDREHGATACEDAAGGDSRITDLHDDDVGIALFGTPGDAVGQCALAGSHVRDLEPDGLARGELLGGSAQAPAH